MKKVINGKVYNSNNPKYVTIAKIGELSDTTFIRIYRATDGNYIRHWRNELKLDSGVTPGAECMAIIFKDFDWWINSFKEDEVHWEYFTEC